MMLQLILYVCLIKHPDVCHNEYLNSRAPSVGQCLGDQISMAQWIEKNPEFFIDRWHCSLAGTEADL